MRLPILLLAIVAPLQAAEDATWWDKSWTQRQTITLDTAPPATTEATGPATVLIRLSDNNFQNGFANASEGGADLRFIADDHKTVLPHHVEKWDSLLNEAYVWVKLPDAPPNAKITFDMYYGGGDPAIGASAKGSSYDDLTSLVYHFGDATPTDSTGNGNDAKIAGTISQSGVAGNGLRLPPPTPLAIPASDSLNWTQGQDMTLGIWIKPASLQPNAVILSRGEGASAFTLLLNNSIPVVQIAGQSSPAGEPVAPAVWTHIAVVSKAGNIQLVVNGKPYGQFAAALPATTAPINLGGLVTPIAGIENFIGEIDELQIHKTARSLSAIQLAAATQASSDLALRTVSVGEVAGGGEAAEHSGGVMEHLSLFGDIAKNMMFDGWIAIGICVVMIVIGWTVAVRKFMYLNSIERGTKVFLKKWKSLSTDLTALDPDDTKSISSLGGQVEGSDQNAIEKSPLYHIYQIGSDEIRNRLDKDKNRVEGLSGRSIQAIRASLDAGLVHESHRLTDGLVYLTISIAGGPYVGLLGTVVGVMITFAIIAKSGEVNVNSIAPGIASALLATVVGLVVAIPALFIYSYLNARIKNSLGLMQVFIDEFVAKMAEFYRPPNDPDAQAGKSSH